MTVPRSIHLFFICLLIFLLSTPALAETVGRLVGRVVDEQAEPLEGVRITVTGPGAVGLYEAATDEDGWYSVLGLPLREPLVVHAEAPGKIGITYSGLYVKRGFGVRRDFRLRAPGVHQILVLVEPDSPPLHTVLEGARRTLPGSVAVLELSGRERDDADRVRDEMVNIPNAVVAIGREAARLAREEITQTPVVYAMVPNPSRDGLLRTNICGIGLNGAIDVQLDRLEELAPDARRLVTLYNPRSLAYRVTELREGAERRGMTLEARPMHRPDQIERALDALAETAPDVFFMLYDPDLFDSRALDMIQTFVEARDLIYVVPDEGLLERGGSFMDAPGFLTMGLEAGMLVRKILGGVYTPEDVGVTFAESRQFRVNPRMSGRLRIPEKEATTDPEGL